MILSMDYDFKMRMSHMGECYLHIHNTKHFMLFDVHIDHLPRKKVIYICSLSIFTSACPLRALLPFTHTHIELLMISKGAWCTRERPTEVKIDTHCY